MSDSILFTPIRVGTVEIPNRFVRSATHDFMAEPGGSVSDRQVRLFKELSEGEVGLIITGHAYVSREGKASPKQISVAEDNDIQGLSRIAETVHGTRSRIFLQIAHAGRQTKPKICGCTPLSPSAVYEPVLKVMPKVMTEEDIRDVIQAFVRAGVRAKKAGFDGIQLHMAHGYLLSSFFSAHTNRRTDDWGGSFANRLRIAVEIVRGLRSRVEDYPLLVKLNSTDLMTGGLTLEESIAGAKTLEKEGVDGIEVSGGMSEAGKGSVWKGQRSKDEEGYFVDSASRVKQEVSVPVFGLGGLRSLPVMERIVREGRADLISMSRPYIRDPFLVRKFRTGEIEKSACISCNKCFNPRGITCADLKKTSP